MRVVHITTSLGNGGAQAVLFNLAIRSRETDQYIISLMGLGKYGKSLRDQGIPVYTLNNESGRLSISSFRELINILKGVKPDVIQTWMYHADLVGGLAGRLAGVKNICWGIHNTRMDSDCTSNSTLLVIRTLVFLSKFIPKKIIVCSQRALQQHVDMGYVREKMCFVPNGYDLHRFNPAVNREIDVGVGALLKEREGDFVIGCVGRWSKQKDQLNLVLACKELKENGIKDFCCLLIGPEMDESNSILISAIQENGLADQVYLVGVVEDVPAVMTSLDVHVLPSAFGEAFPNVVAEAMACGTPCIVTDVGDSGDMVSESGWVVPPKNYQLLAGAIQSAREEVGTPMWIGRKNMCREIALENFGIDEMVTRYKHGWNSVAN